MSQSIRKQWLRLFLTLYVHKLEELILLRWQYSPN